MSSGAPACDPFVRVSSDGALLIGDRPTFLNGVNIAWINWPDFGGMSSHATAASIPSYCGFEDALRFVAANGGNAIRVWMLQDPDKSLRYAADGTVASLAPGVVLQAQSLLELARHYDVRVVLVLFNGAQVRGAQTCALFDGARVDVFESLLARAIRPLAAALRGYESLAMLEVINEPEALIDRDQLHGEGADGCADGQSVATCAAASTMTAGDGTTFVADGVGWFH
mgnify:CR=1 FL=1